MTWEGGSRPANEKPLGPKLLPGHVEPLPGGVRGQTVFFRKLSQDRERALEGQELRSKLNGSKSLHPSTVQQETTSPTPRVALGREKTPPAKLLCKERWQRRQAQQSC